VRARPEPALAAATRPARTPHPVDGLWHIGASTHPGPGLAPAQALSSRSSCCDRASPSGSAYRNQYDPPSERAARLRDAETRLGEIHDLVKVGSLLSWDSRRSCRRAAARYARTSWARWTSSRTSPSRRRHRRAARRVRPYEESLDA
jgi:hypothetical protein